MRNAAIRGIARGYSQTLVGALWVSAFLTFALMIYITGDVVGRFFANAPLPVAHELSESAMVFIVFFALAYVQARKGHLRITFVPRRFGPVGQVALDVLASAIGFFVIALMIWKGAGWAWEGWISKTYTASVPIVPLYPSRFAVVVGLSLLWIQYGIDIFKDIRHLTRRGVNVP